MNVTPDPASVVEEVAEPRSPRFDSRQEIRNSMAVYESRRDRGGDRRGNRDVLDRPSGHVVRPEDREPILPETHGAWTGMTDWANCPPSYDVWAEQYYPEARTWVRRSGVHFSQVDDVVQEIMTRFEERDSLGVFRRNWETRSASGKSNFRSYFSNFVVGYASGKHRNNVRYLAKHSFVFDAQVGEDGSTWGDLCAPPVEDVAPGAAEFSSVIAQVRAVLHDDALVDAVLLLAQEGAVRQSGLREALGCTPRVAKSGLEAVRAALLAALAESA